VVATPQTIKTNATTFLRRFAKDRAEKVGTPGILALYTRAVQGAVTDVQHGQLVHVFMVSILDAALLSWVALLWYRRSVRRLMREGEARAAAGDPPLQPLSATASPPSDPSGEFSLREEQPGSTNIGSVLSRGERRRVILAYVLGAAAYSAVVTTLKYAPEPPAPAVVWLVEWWTNTWPIVPTLTALLVLDRPALVRLALGYVLGGAAAIALFTAAGQLLRGTLNTAPVTNVFWAMVSLAVAASLPLALVALTGWRRVRAVTPLVLAATLLFGFGLLLANELFIRAMDTAFFSALVLDSPALSSSGTARYMIYMVVSLPVGWIAWRLLTGLADAYAKKRFSDVQLVIDCWWAIVAAEVTATSLAGTHGFVGIAGGIGAFLAYRVSVFAVLRDFRRAETAPRRLLLLRVFGYQARTESLFDRVAEAWRFHGPVQLIAGVDLAMRTTDPGDLLALLNGRLADLYVRTLGDVSERLARLDLHADPDGRFRINEVYCRADTWRPTLTALVDASDVVLMDLRSFSANNAGCVFELQQLVGRLRSDDIVFVCDRTTDLALLRSILRDARITARDAGRARGPDSISVVRVERNSRAEIEVLMRRLLVTANPAAAAS
jgi:hypothetical protein